MTAWIDAFAPAFGLLALGAVLRARLLRDDAIWAGIERLVFWVLLPSLLAYGIGGVDLAALPLGRLAAVFWLVLVLGAVLAVLLARALGHGHPAMTSVLQGGIRFNNLMGFAIAGSVFGAPGIALGAIATGLIVPCVQVVTTLAFALGGGRRPRPLSVLRQMALNPLIIGCAAGFGFSVLGGVPPGLSPILRVLGNASVALGLLTVGAALSADALRDRIGTQALTGALKLLVMPLLTWGLCLAVGLDPLATAICVLFMALPTAATSYVMARAMGGDAPLMAAITTTEHLAAVLTLPLWMLLVTP